MNTNLIETLEGQNETINEIKDLCIKAMFDADMVKNMSPDDLKLLQLTLKLVEQSVDVNIEVAKMLESIKADTEWFIKRAQEVGA